jgi:hypothetical protein
VNGVLGMFRLKSGIFTLIEIDWDDPWKLESPK